MPVVGGVDALAVAAMFMGRGGVYRWSAGVTELAGGVEEWWWSAVVVEVVAPGPGAGLAGSARRPR